ncbi:exostosin-3-like [Oppia nitens]|uniref:exostosin-3-like n=1 Tax=Oppia nitens TaxID=1686743 RepID=UPI0023DAAF97|nr:exostosin-3-like [Oppia nitens]
MVPLARNRVRLTRCVHPMAAIIIFLLLFLCLLSHYYINSVQSMQGLDSLVKHLNSINGNSRIDSNNNFDDLLNGHKNSAEEDNDITSEDKILLHLKATDMEHRVRDLLKIRASVRNELRELESRRRTVMQELSEAQNKLEVMQSQLIKKQQEMDRINLSLKQTKYAQKEVQLRSNSLLVPPLQLLPSAPQTNDIQINNDLTIGRNGQTNGRSYHWCRMHNCFDYSRCSLFSPFLLYFYHPEDVEDIDDVKNIDAKDEHKLDDEFHKIRTQILDIFNGNIHVTFDPTIACVYVVILFKNSDHQLLTKDYYNQYLHSLPYWAGDGRNHIIINTFTDLDLQSTDGIDLQKASLVQTNFNLHTFRPNFDIILPQINKKTPLKYERTEDNTVSMVPSRRKYLVTYLGSIDSNNYIHKQIMTTLLKVSSHLSTNNEFLLDFVCDEKTKRLCDNQTLVLRQSTFALILPPIDNHMIFTTNMSISLVNILSSGSIPVIIGGDYLRLPFDEVIDWRLATISIPIARITELHFLLRTYSDADIIEMRRFGQLFLDRHLISVNGIISTILSLVRQSRLQIPSPVAREEPSQTLFNETNPMKFFDATSGLVLIDTNPEIDENLGPIEPSFPSQVYQRNYSLVISNGYRIWNDHRFDPFLTFPATPFDPLLSSDAKYIGSSYGFRPIGGGTGGSGKEFSESLGGNVPKEQFTIVILTYEREAVLIDSLQRLKGLPYLNKVLVIWNSPRAPSIDLRWPELGAPIRVIRAKRNSLNNRFLPYADIETEAVLSMDDDAHLRHDEIIFGFRVWREARDRIVGFPGRYHAWDDMHTNFLYNSNYSCELSMVLTGAAFFHKYYSYLYTYSMPKAIRDKVDEYMNCEDIAMNYLVSHITRQPPIKVTSRWTFRCPGCPVSLSEDDSHFNERHKCINYFIQIYGYMPLLNTQFRADSVLFKTRIPHDKQKCFKFI